MRQPMPPATPDDTPSDSYSQHEDTNQCKVKASIISFDKSDDEIIKVLAPEIEKFGMIKMTIKIATDDDGKQYRWVVIQFDDVHDFNDFRHYITNQKGTISIFGNVLNFKFISGKNGSKDRQDMRSTKKRKYNERAKSDHSVDKDDCDKDGGVLKKTKIDADSSSKIDQELHDSKYNNPLSNVQYDDDDDDTRDDRKNYSSDNNHYNGKDGRREYSFSNNNKSDLGDRKSSFFRRYDDNTPTRTLYFGNLDRDVDFTRMKRLFSQHGRLLDIVVKRQGRFSAYGFVKFLHLRDALEAKNQLAGTFINKNRMAVGFGSICQTCLIWVGDYARQIDVDEICCEVKKHSDYLDYLLGKDQSFIYFVFKDVSSALKVLNNLRGFRLNNHRHPVQVDFADPRMEARYLYEQHHKLDRSNARMSSDHSPTQTDNNEHYRKKQPTMESTCSPPCSIKNLDLTSNGKLSYQQPPATNTNNEKHHRSSREDEPRSGRVSTKSYSTSKSAQEPTMKSTNPHIYIFRISQNARLDVLNVLSTTDATPIDNLPPSTSNFTTTSNSTGTCLCGLQLTTSTSVLAFPMVWKGYLCVKNQSYGTKLHQLAGNINLMNSVFKSSPPTSNFSFYKRYPLSGDNLEEFKTDLASAVLCNEYCAFIGLPCCANSQSTNNGQSNEKPLKELIQYLHEKNAAVRITDFDPVNQLSLFVFPPCDFSREFLSSTLTSDNRMILSLAASSHVLVFVTK